MTSVVGVLLILVALVVGAIAALWTLFRAGGGEVDLCPDGRDCITAYWITVPAMLVAAVVLVVGIGLARRR